MLPDLVVLGVVCVCQVAGAVLATVAMAWLIPAPADAELDQIGHHNEPAGRGSAPLPPLE